MNKGIKGGFILCASLVAKTPLREHSLRQLLCDIRISGENGVGKERHSVRLVLCSRGLVGGK
jgi:hypothetical protein